VVSVFTRFTLKFAIAIARGFYALVKIFPVQDKVTFLSRGNSFTSIDFQLLGQAIERERPSTSAVFLNHPLSSLWKVPFQMVVEMYHISTSRAVVIDTYIVAVSVLKHRPQLKVLQIWHALGAFKVFGRMAIGRAEGSAEGLARVMHMHENYTYVSAPSTATAAVYQQCFGIHESRIVLAGSPRVDYLLDDATQRRQREILMEKYEIPRDREVVLFAPTFRKNSAIPVDELARQIDTDRFVLLLRKHPLDDQTVVSDLRVIITDESEGIELLAVADHLVTDYSAIVFEASLRNIPVYFWTFDREEYAANRGFMIDFDTEAPGPITDSAVAIAHEIATAQPSSRISEFASKYVETTHFNNADRLAQLLLAGDFPADWASS
jgi:CDP-ribitol ribitolphosphotransferase